MLFALTLHRPWGWAIATSSKPVENRDWTPPAALIGKWIAIHNGKAYDAEGAEWIRRMFHLAVPTDGGPAGAIVAVVHLAGYITKGLDGSIIWPKGPTEKPVRAAMEGREAWFVGKYGWVFDQVCPLRQPIICRGMQKLWTVPEDARVNALAQYQAWRAERAA